MSDRTAERPPTARVAALVCSLVLALALLPGAGAAAPLGDGALSYVPVLGRMLTVAVLVGVLGDGALAALDRWREDTDDGHLPESTAPDWNAGAA